MSTVSWSVSEFAIATASLKLPGPLSALLVTEMV